LAPADLSRASRLAGAAVALWALAAGAFALNRSLVGVFYDDGLYAGLAVALASGDGYAHPHLPGGPAAIHYPPLYPAVLAPLFGLLSRDAAGFAGKAANLLFAAAAAGLITAHATRIRLLGERVPVWLPGVVVAAAAVAAPVLTTQSVLFAEPLFGLLLASTVILGDRAAAQSSGRSALAAGVGAALTLLTRTIGVAAGVAAVMFVGFSARAGGGSPTPLAPGTTDPAPPLGRSRRGTPAARSQCVRVGGPVAVASVGWLVWTMVHREEIDPALAINYGSYGEVLRQAGLGALGSSALDLPRPLFALTLGWLPRAIALPLGLLGVAIGLYGLYLVLRRSSIGITLVGYLAILAIWPFPPDRFLWAVLPWLALVWTAGAATLLASKAWRIPVAIIAASALVGYGLYEVRALRQRGWVAEAAAISANFTELLPALRDLPPDAVLATDNEALVWLYAGRSAVPLYVYGYAGAAVTHPSTAEHRAYLERQGVTHVVLASASSPSAGLLRSLIHAYPDWLQPVHQWPGGRWIFVVGPS
jgi:hypothetical protein